MVKKASTPALISVDKHVISAAVSSFSMVATHSMYESVMVERRHFEVVTYVLVRVCCGEIIYCSTCLRSWTTW